MGKKYSLACDPSLNLIINSGYKGLKINRTSEKTKIARISPIIYLSQIKLNIFNREIQNYLFHVK